MFPLLWLVCVVAIKVFKKSAPNGKLTVYLGKRDFGDYGDSVEPVEGVVLVDSDYLKDRKVFGQVVTTFRYGREEDEVMGLHFSRQLYLALDQIYPTDHQQEKSELQDKLLRKLGDNAIPFTFDLPENAPPSVTLQPGTDENGSPLGVEYELKLFVAESKEEKPHRRNSVSMAIRKLQYHHPGPNIRQPSSLVSKGFVLSPGKLQLEVTLDKEFYFHGDKIAAQMVVTNHSKKTIRNIKVNVIQNTEVTIVNGHYHKSVASIETKEGCPIIPGATLTKVFYLLPSADDNLTKRGVALDGMLKEGDTNLASSTLKSADNLGIIISYMVRVRLYMGAIGGELVADVPFKLTSPPPEKQKEVTSMQKKVKKQLSREMSTDLVFEDFARRRQYSEDNE
ncbi:arrestin, lateral eye-like [Argiope bruennichi]|uniref:Arrestin like protein n=1 Tax=Argiope bruennichi TaxID=94029 RepID=A0A8T0ESN5_ARGBR|nr:arrestin, lateral eye-like [Argiope bruennichi]KAF8778757.1 Arrestin like protein [Argiope bruennichi]